MAEELQKLPDEFDLSRPRKALASAMTELNIPYVDLHEQFQIDQRRLFINNDIHLNIVGNQLVADSLPAGWFQESQTTKSTLSADGTAPDEG